MWPQSDLDRQIFGPRRDFMIFVLVSYWRGKFILVKIISPAIFFIILIGSAEVSYHLVVTVSRTSSAKIRNGENKLARKL